MAGSKISAGIIAVWMGTFVFGMVTGRLLSSELGYWGGMSVAFIGGVVIMLAFAPWRKQ